jgi:hypothetical protein
MLGLISELLPGRIIITFPSVTVRKRAASGIPADRPYRQAPFTAAEPATEQAKDG